MRKMKDFVPRHFVAILAAALILFLAASNIFQLVEVRRLKSKMTSSEIIYQPAQEMLIESNFYPGRIYGEYSDYVFCFDEYLDSIGATEITRYVYTAGEGTFFELRFKLDGNDWKLKTSEYRTQEIYTYGLYSTIEVNTGKVSFIVPTGNYGTHICDATSPFKIDWVIFDVFHNATDKNSELRKELRAGQDESNCPFRGLGIGHYEKWSDGKTFWHDDLGDFTIDDGLDLHY